MNSGEIYKQKCKLHKMTRRWRLPLVQGWKGWEDPKWKKHKGNTYAMFNL